MLLAIDIGNTNIVFGLFKDNDLIGDLRLKTDAGLSAFACQSLIRAQFAGLSFSIGDVQEIVMASVVPSLDAVLAETCKTLFGHEPFTVDVSTITGITVDYETPHTLGMDRIVNAVAAYDRFKTAAIAVDMGTATTFDYIDAGGAYCGGAIAPGISTAAEALFQNAAKLPRIELAYPERLIGRSTVESMQSGIVAGYAAMVSGIIEGMKTEAGADAGVIATGGLASLVAGHISAIDEVDEHLLLKGLKIIHDRRNVAR